tara:strand:+ start:498 stop:2777 length:2280 start_codon:yes stop_codon:yes gene_type:complete
MISNQKLFSVGSFDFRLQHLLVIGVLVLSVSISMMIRSTPVTHGFELFEFDPFFNYRATEYILENGTDAYFNWIDEKSWHPFGRNVSETSQVTLHLTAASLYPIFNFGLSLYDFAVLLPLVFGSLTAVAVFAFVRVLSGTTAGLFAALIFSVSVPIFTRGLIGWFKSEPLGLFFAFLAMYLFVSGFKFNKGKISLIKLIAAGLFLSLGLSAWGGILFFIIPVVLFYFSLPFIKNKDNFIMWAAPSFSISLILFSLIFERTSTFIIGYAGLAILLPTIFILVSGIIMKFGNEYTKIRNSIIVLIGLIASGIGIVNLNLVGLPSFRYLNAVNPFLTTQDSLTDSVAEHTTTSLSLSYTFLSVFLIFAVIGIWFLFSRKTINLKTDMRIFAIFISIIAIYVSSAFVRLELFASIGMIILGSIGLAILSQKIFEQNDQNFIKLIFPAIIIILFIIPVTMPENNSWLSWADFPPSILNGGTSYTQFTSNDWKDTMNWIKENTSEDAIIASWWDYGYWITTLSERTTLADNATLNDYQIKKIAYTLITTPENAWHILSSNHTDDVSEYFGDENVIAWGGSSYSDWLAADKKNKDCKSVSATEAKILDIDQKICFPVGQGLDADYLVIYIAGERFYTENSNIPLYTLEGGGDESKKTWYAAISNHQISKYVQDDNITPTTYYMENSTLGMLTPFSIFKYVEPNTGRTFDQYHNGFIPVYLNDLKLKDPENDPFYLVYASPSFYSQQPGPMSAVLIYKINHDYNPQN